MAITVDNTQQGSRVGQIYWRGADGNIYLKGAGGDSAAVTNLGNSVPTWDLILNGATEVGDPNAPQQTQNNGNNGLVATGSGSDAPKYKDTTASRNATQVSIDSLGTILNNALAGASGEHKSVTDAYDLEDAENLGKYKGDVEKNEINRDTSTQASLLGAARGSRGLYATLASLGALNGTGRTLANRAVSTEANADLGEGEKTFDTNVTGLFDARSILEKQEKQRRLDADKILADANQNAEYDYYKGNQDLSKEMAGLWADAGNFGEAGNWTNRSSTYTPEMAKRTKVNVGQYAKNPLAYSAPALNKYLGGQNSMAVNVAADNPINGALYTTTSPRKDKELV